MINDAVRYLRMSEGLSIDDLSKEVGISTVTLGNIERGHENISMTSIKKVCAYYELSVAELYNLGRFFQERTLLSLMIDVAKGKAI